MDFPLHNLSNHKSNTLIEKKTGKSSRMPQLLVLIDVLNYGCCQGQQKSQKKKKCIPVAKNGQTMKKIASH